MPLGIQGAQVSRHVASGYTQLRVPVRGSLSGNRVGSARLGRWLGQPVGTQ